LYAGGIAAFAESGVLRAVVNGPVLLLVLIVAPLVALLALLVAVIVSSRVNDARSAQQLGALIVLPVTLLFVLQLIRGFLIGAEILVIAAATLVILNVVLLAIGVRVFDRERILTDWK
jgi:ABC-2 type transport system permease protein